MITKTLYIANDGKEFTSKQECIDYEREHCYGTALLKSIKYYADEDGTKKLSLEEALMDLGNVYAMYIPSYEALDEVQKEFVRQEALHPWEYDGSHICSKNIGAYVYLDKWVYLPDYINELLHAQNRIHEGE